MQREEKKKSASAARAKKSDDGNLHFALEKRPSLFLVQGKPWLTQGEKKRYERGPEAATT